jgi:25S rRNA (uracil2843-N3)-methyltransferase
LILAAPSNALFLIIGRLDSSSEILVRKDDQGKEKKTYPIRYLLNMVLIDHQLGALYQELTWETLFKDQSRLFRVAERLKYPICLENIKFQIHLFRKL